MCVQNVFVGLALGTAENDHALFIAIVFHQFFEGLGLGSRVATANLKRFISILIIDIIFAASAPVGIGIGIGVKSALENDDYAYSIVDGTFQALSGGILIYVALVHMLRGYTEVDIKGLALHWHKYAIPHQIFHRGLASELTTVSINPPTQAELVPGYALGRRRHGGDRHLGLRGPLYSYQLRLGCGWMAPTVREYSRIRRRGGTTKQI